MFLPVRVLQHGFQGCVKGKTETTLKHPGQSSTHVVPPLFSLHVRACHARGTVVPHTSVWPGSGTVRGVRYDLGMCGSLAVWEDRETSVYLSDSLAARWRASGLPLSELIRRGLEHGSDADTLTRTLDGIVRTALREELRPEQACCHRCLIT